MRQIAHDCFRITLTISLFLPVNAFAIPAITCHCFTDRSYDPARPSVADPYFLATTANSFLSVAFGVEKKTIVIKKQRGASGEDLWIAYWLASRTGSNLEQLLERRKTATSWHQTAARLKVPAGKISDAIKANATDERMANAVVDELLLRYRFLSDSDLTLLRKSGADNKELIMSGFISLKSRQPAILLFREVKLGKQSWGALLQRYRIETAGINSDVAALMSASGSARGK